MRQVWAVIVTGACPFGYGAFPFVSERFQSVGAAGDCARLTK